MINIQSRWKVQLELKDFISTLKLMLPVNSTHGPLALIDADMPIIVVAPNNELLEKLQSNVEEVRLLADLYVVRRRQRPL